ncbi:MAG: hypothetical protein JW862_05095 [Anaerolineales bacterium]|nr:hypothetical protein [Anaerolineales bacterium]
MKPILRWIILIGVFLVILILGVLVVYNLYNTLNTSQPMATIDVQAAIAQTVAALPTKTPPPTQTPVPITPTPSITPTERPTRTPLPSITPIPVLATRTPFPTGIAASPERNPRERFDEPTFIDLFETADNWTLFDTACFRSVVQNDHYVMTGKFVPSGLCWEVTWPRIQDFYVETRVKVNACEGQDRYGLFFRGPNARSGYFFGLTCEQEYFLTKWDGEARQSEQLIDYTEFENIQFAGQYNTLGVWANGPQLGLYINGFLITEIRDESYTGAGLLGFFLSTDVTADLTVEFDELAYWILE